MRSLSNRHVQMIAIGGTIGTGLFLGSGSTISKTGPSVMLVYLILGLFFFFMMRAIGEMFYADTAYFCFIHFQIFGANNRTFYWLDLLDWFSICLHGWVDCNSDLCPYWLPSVPAWIIELVFRNSGECQI